ncbi:hypothetical protein PMIN01_10965 [Paraphaeosphaeria minitans]|uniref:Uncharacterized protein n=1 Tax=Paraphaeosphaeria minitans TaxID=565426 RepID=A0A9P6G8S6_9PLEO|nr:hypothetical protein PMIN01_10965 [Paraphaeosphaeria minitans]
MSCISSSSTRWSARRGLGSRLARARRRFRNRGC